MKCDDDLRHRALAKAKGDYEAHAVGTCANGYAVACETGKDDWALIAEAQLRMFVDTTLRWKEAHAAVTYKLASPRAKRFKRVRNKLGRWLNEDERKRLRKLLA